MGEKLQFGEHGELTEETINSVDLTSEERERALVILKVQEAYLEILDAMSYPTDPEGHTYDLSALGPIRLALAWTLALNGFRKTGEPLIKKRFFGGDQVIAGAHTWVDVRAADDAAEDLLPEHRADDPSLPPDTRMLAAQRDAVQAVEMPRWDGVKPKIVMVDEPRPEWMR